MSIETQDKQEIDNLNRNVTSAIFKAEELSTQLVNAWLAVAETEKQLAISLPFGPERRIAERGMYSAKTIADKIKELTTRVKGSRK